MPDPGPYVASLLVALLVVFMVWFALGTGYNVRRGNDVLRWLQTGLPILGRRTTVRWLGSSAVELKLAEAKEPFREATVLVVLEPRDVVWLWALSRARGRRDVLIVRADLRRAPRLELEAFDPAGWMAGEVGGGFDGEAGWKRIDWPATSTTVEGSWRGQGDPEAARRAWTRLGPLSSGVWRISIRQTVPHLQVHVRPPDLATVGADDLLGAIRDLALELGS
jgi:hypothetical protein